MADIESKIKVDIDTSQALSNIKFLQQQISAFQQAMAKAGSANAALAQQMQKNLVDSINGTGKFQANIQGIQTVSERFTSSLEKNKFSIGEYFRYAGGATKSFGKLFKTEFQTIDTVARERVKDLQTQYIKLGRDASGAMQAIKVRPLTLDMQNLATQTMMSAQKQQLLNQLLKQGSTAMLNWGKNTQWAGRQLMVGFTIPLTMMGSAAAKAYMDIEKASIQIKRVYGDMNTTSTETDKVVKSIRALANEYTKYGVAVADTMDMAAKAAAMGKTGADLLAQVNEASKLSVLGQVDQQQALETTISMTNAFGTATEELAGKIDFLNAVENQTVTSIDDLTVAIPKAAPVIRQLGGDVEDLAFFLTAMREGGINASEGANALKSGLAAMINPTAKASEFLMGFGVNLKGIVEANKGDVKGTIVEFAKALDTLDPLNRAQAIEQLFGKFQFSRLSTLFQNVIKEGNQASRVLKLTNATTEELAILSERELKRVEDSPMFKFQKAVEDLKVSLVPVGEAFLKAVTPIVEFGAKLLEKFNGLDEGAKSFVVGLTAVLGAIGPIAIMTFGLLANGVANIIKGFLFVKNVFTGAGRSSKELGSQLQYMTSEQLEAAAVAASLDQVHNKLVQTFSSESGALANLAAAYQKAISAQMAFNTAGAARGPRKKMATGGVVSGPGTGTSDSVPAMLSNGEAVIPAKSVKEYPGLVAGLIAGNIPGFAQGVQSVGRQTMSMHASHFEQLSPQNLGGTISRLGAALEGFTVEIFSLRRKAKAEEGYIASKTTGPLSSLANSPAILAGGRSFAGTTVPETPERNLAYEAAGIGGTAFNMKEVVANGDKAAAALASQSAESIRYADELKILVNESKEAKKILANKNVAEQKQLAFMRNNAKNAITAGLMDRKKLSFAEAQIEAEKRLTAVDNELATLRKSGTTTQKLVNSAEQKYLTTMLQTNNQYGQGPAGSGRRSLRDLVANRVRRTGPDSVQRDFARGEGPYSGKTATALNAMKMAAMKIVFGMEKGAVDGIKQATKQASPSKAAKKSGSNIGVGAIQGIETAVPGAKAAGVKIAAATQSGVNEAALIAAGKNARKMGRNEQGPLLPGQKRQRALPKMSMQGAGGAGMAASGVLMAASMAPGKVGEIAQQAMGPVMALTMILPLLSSGVGAIVVALGAMAAAVIAMKMQFDAAQESALKLTETMGTGSKAMEGYAKFAGNATAGEVMDKRRANSMSMFQIQSGKTTFGQSYVQGEEGKQKVQDIRTSMQKSGRGATVSSMVNQMASAVASGALDSAQARSIVANLATEMGDTSFGIQVTGELNKILGPNGENLEKDPLKVRMELMENTRSNLKKGSESLSATMGMTGKDGLQLGGGIAAGAGVGAGVGAVAGGLIGGTLSLGTLAVPAAAVGAAVGTVVGAISGGIIGSIERSNRIAAVSGAIVGLQKEALQQQQEMIDSLDLTYQRKIEEAKAAGDVAEAERLTNEYIAARPKLLAQQGQLNADIQASYEGADAGAFGGLFSAFGGGGARAAMNSGADKAIDATFKGTANEDMANVVTDQIKGASLTDAQDYNLRVAFSTGDIDPLLLSGFLGQFGSNAEVMNKTMNIVTTMGGAFAADTMQVMNMFVDKDGKPLVEQQTKFIANMSAKSPEDAAEYLDLFLNAKNVGQVVDLGATMSFYVNNPTAQKAMTDAQKMIDEHKGKMNMSFVTDVVGAENVDAVVRAGKDFTNLDAEQQKVFTSTMKNILLMEGDQAMQDAYELWLTEPGNAGKMFDDFAVTKAVQVTQASADSTLATKKEEPKPTGGSGTPSSVLDSLLKKLKEIRKIQVKVTEGWAASGKELMKYFGGKNTITVFNGIKQQMRALGAGEDLIELIAGMDPKEYEKQKNKLFEFDKKGNIVKLKSLALATGKALKAIALGEFQNQQQQIVVDIKNQTTALNRLIGAGIGVSDAYGMVEDAAFAAAIASKKLTDSELKKIVKATKEAIAAMKLYKASQGVAASNEDFANNSKVIAKLAASNYTDEQRQAILDSADLQTLYLQSSLSAVDFKRFQTALANAVKGTKLEIDTNKLTTEGLETNFANAMNKAMERVNAQEMEINLRFDADQKAGKDVIEAAQRKIDDYQYEIDDLDASLKPIEEAEKKINEEYDARVKALDEVASINEDISRQQKQQLSVAEAITSGDISAAAKAAQDARSAEAAEAIANQKKALEKNKDLTLAGLVNAQGLSRAQVEEKIKGLKDKIFEIEENTLEPAQRSLELSERRRDAALAEVEATKLRLQLLQNEADIAKTKQPDYVNAEANANTIGDALGDAYANGGNVSDGTGVDNGPTQACPPDPTTKGKDPKMTYTWNTKTCTWDAKKKTIVNNSSSSSSASDSGVVEAKKPTGDAGYGKKWVYDKASNKWNATAVNQPSGTPYANAVWIWDTDGDKWNLKAPKPTKAAPGGGTWVYNAGSNTWDIKPPSMTQGVKKDDLFTTMGKGIANFAAGLFGFSSGGMVPKYFDKGGIAAAFSNTFANNTDTIPAMLTPGEFVVKKSSVDSIGYKNLQRINNTGTLGGNSVYNYDVNINVKSEANVNDISRAVITEIKRIDSQRIRGNRL
jgi:TP901 family phage tail tape measure protein